MNLPSDLPPTPSINNTSIMYANVCGFDHNKRSVVFNSLINKYNIIFIAESWFLMMNQLPIINFLLLPLSNLLNPPLVITKVVFTVLHIKISLLLFTFLILR